VDDESRFPADDPERREQSRAQLGQTIVQLEAFRRGDTAALDSLFRRYSNVVNRIVATRLGRTAARFAEIEDIAQEALMSAFRNLGEFEATGEGTFRNWLARIVENKVLDAWRRDQAQRRGGGRVQRLSEIVPEDDPRQRDGTIPSPSPTPSEVYAGRELELQREAVLLQLGEFQRELVNLREHCGMTFDEVAAELDLRSPDAARMAYNRASQAVQERLRRLRNE
jgi:RNA polymerase sigma factor (sigma-70 family)